MALSRHLTIILLGILTLIGFGIVVFTPAVKETDENNLSSVLDKMGELKQMIPTSRRNKALAQGK
jgi:hypothetical protein